ncbi:hypothetical protein [Nocardia pseudovaccinii]|uniref:hypothetical protein n=1 Tax=Nocardia pseudovaccinii TaxID=189540 RepID=UPI0007A4F2F6|nr:hypothetical protein [Nocardia pseudovaccinii]
MGSKADRRVARERVAAYHKARLGELIEQVGRAVDRLRAGELDVFEVDEVIHRYHRAAQRLWVFCGPSGAQVESTAALIERMDVTGEAIDWWQRAGKQSADG